MITLAFLNTKTAKLHKNMSKNAKNT